MIGVISGPVNSGKTKELIHQGMVFKGKVKTFRLWRAGLDAAMKSKDGIVQIACESIKTPWAMMIHAQELPRESMIMIDDGHLFHYDLVHVCLKMSFEYNHCVMVAGRAQDWFGRPNDVMRDMMVVSDQVMKLYGTCKFCSKPYGSKTIEISSDGELDYVSTVEECACNQCYKHLMDQNKAPYVGNVSPAEVAMHNAKTKRRKSVSTAINDLGLELISKKLES